MAYLDQYDLTLHAEFGRRVTMAMVFAATQIMAEEAITEGHGKRVDLANRALNAPDFYAQRFVYAVAANPAITAASADNDIAFTVNAVFNALAGHYL